jgi:hypothetical protein
MLHENDLLSRTVGYLSPSELAGKMGESTKRVPMPQQQKTS